MKGIVESHGGTVEKFIGDAVMAVFGVPQVHEDDALRACRAAVEMRDALPDLGRPGAHRREHRRGRDRHRGAAATGDAVNVAARLEQAAQPGEILIGESTLRLVRDAVDADPVDPIELKGKAESVPAYRLWWVHEAPSAGTRCCSSAARASCGSPRGLGARAIETKLRAGHRAGHAGVGKSRLAQSSHPSDASVVRGRCLPYGEGSATGRWWRC